MALCARPLRIELAGGLYHVTSRGNLREAIYRDAQDRLEWLAVLGELCRRFYWRCHPYCEMTNHYLPSQAGAGNWAEEVEGPLGDAFRRAARAAGLPEAVRRKYEAPATHQEISGRGRCWCSQAHPNSRRWQ